MKFKRRPSRWFRMSGRNVYARSRWTMLHRRTDDGYCVVLGAVYEVVVYHRGVGWMVEETLASRENAVAVFQRIHLKNERDRAALRQAARDERA